MSVQKSVLIFSSNPVKKRHHWVRFWVGFALVIGIIQLGYAFQWNSYALLVLAVAIFAVYLNLLGVYNPFLRDDEVIVTATALKGASLQRSGRAYFMLDNLLVEPIMVKRMPPQWLQWLYPRREWVAINQNKQPYGFKMDVSLLNEEDQQAVLQVLQERFRAESI